MEKISIGIIQKPHGVRGEVKVFPKTDFVEERFKKGQEIDLLLNGKTTHYVIDTVRKHQGSVLVKFVGLDNLNDVEFFHKGELFIPRDEMHDLPDNEYYFVDLVGCDVYVEGATIGSVSEMIETPAHPVMRVKGTERDILIPFVERFILDVNIVDKRIDVDWMEGL
ncbi:16S rRNA processing protein RimM [Erysipelothrix sp. HDW6C]|uniref:ribosome maturation factor RimM n=1 Tax=Erysipelothrix sp. HDW6C TaxID=2714930 RepID=UPI001408E2A8|nr:ribosome maturation factor RimM [Erysipelothrix sp. HDW6C]QIK69967.1 16S rRNA processing protein RimM [Erysipelothrix sp. HDW6C]